MTKISIYLYVLVKKLCSRWLPTKIYLKLLYVLRFGHRLNLNMPLTFNEKLQWLKIYDHNPEYTNDVDKYLVRDKIQDIFGEKYLVPLLGCYKTPEEIKYESLPDRFVLKCTHGTHCSIACTDKTKFDIDAANQSLKKWMKHNYYYDAREWPYKNVRPRIICEEYICDNNNDLVDYKFLCFSGKVKYIMVHQDIFNEKGLHTLDLYTPSWEKTDIQWGIPNSSTTLPKPACLNECIHICEILSSGRPHVRVDLYIVDDKIYFGELTYYSAAGFKPFENYADDERLGSLIQLKGYKS